MQISELWLREWINIKVNRKELIEQINMIGLEVNKVKQINGLKFSNVIVGEIVECKKHLNSNTSFIVKVNINEKYLISTICNAKNCHQGIKVAVATINSIGPNNLRIQELKSFNKLSEYILCSFATLGISENQNIIELPTSTPIGEDVYRYLKLDDSIIEINITPNRADCLSIIGIARDLATVNQIEINELKILPSSITTNETLSIQIDTPEICPRYLGRIIKGINVKAYTPLWIRERLTRCGIHLVNVIIDITNYILLELGQPVHIFDKDCIEKGIIVRKAKQKETILLTDGRIVKLNTDILVIADHKKIIEIGGILASKYSSISDKTKNIFIECAFFNPLAIMGKARRFGIYTAFSHRYERGVDFKLQHKAMERITNLLVSICGGDVGPIIDCTSEIHLPKRKNIILRRKKLDHLIGCHISTFQVNKILHRLGFKIIKNKDNWKIASPSWRFDIKIEEDIIEEVARMYGYNNIPCEPLIQTCISLKSYRKSFLSLKRVKTMLNDKGYQEVITYSFVNPRIQKLIHPNKKPLILLNPISNEMSVMRLSLMTGLLETIIYNQNRQQNRIRIFETGLRFIPNEKSELKIRQDFILSAAIVGNRYEEHWSLEKNPIDFFDIKGDLESILDLTDNLSEVEFRKELIPALHPGQSAALYLKGEYIGYIGVIHPKLLHKLNLNNRTIVFELEWNKIPNRILPQVRGVSKFPSIRRDISVLVPQDIPASDILTECEKSIVNYVVSVNLFDLYQGCDLKDGYKSLAISFTFQNKNRTLEEEEVSLSIERCIEILKEKFQVSLRT